MFSKSRIFGSIPLRKSALNKRSDTANKRNYRPIPLPAAEVDFSTLAMKQVTTKQLAVVLGISERWVYWLLRQGILKHSDPYGRALFDAEESVKAFTDHKAQQIQQQADEMTARLKQIWEPEPSAD